MKVLVVGGGTAGLITACILKKRLSIQVDVVYSKNVGIIGVGEGSTEHFNSFMEYMGIDFNTIIQECDATFKSGIMFEGWNESPYLHSTGGVYGSKAGQYNFIYGKMLSEGYNYINSPHAWNSVIEQSHLSSSASPPYNQYHFNTFKLNDFLTKVAKSLEVSIFEDDIVDTLLNESGEIDYIVGNKRNYDYDFYVDCTGFKRLLMSKLGARWISFGKYLKMKSAITFPTLDEENYNLWTLSKAMDYGWMFKIPVWGRHGNGYIFDSDYIDEEQAKKEVESVLGLELEIGKRFNFDPGCLENVWIKNCVAIGLSGSFVEPLEATSIGTSIQQAFLLMHRLPNYDDNTVKSYNKSVNDILFNIRDFLFLHYMVKKSNSIFWNDVKSLEVPESLQNKLELWNLRLPIEEDFCDLSKYVLFRDQNFISVLHGLRLLNYEAIHKEYSYLHSNIRNFADMLVNEHEIAIERANTFTHKEFIAIVRKNKK